MTPIEILEHEKFATFFSECVAEAYRARAEILEKLPPHKRRDVKFKRTALDALEEKGLLLNTKFRKEAIYACIEKRSNLPRRERDFLEHLTLRAGAKLVAHLNQSKKDADVD